MNDNIGIDQLIYLIITSPHFSDMAYEWGVTCAGAQKLLENARAEDIARITALEAQNAALIEAGEELSNVLRVVMDYVAINNAQGPINEALEAWRKLREA